MNHYLSMEHLKLRHSYINWVVVATNVIAVGFTGIMLLTAPLTNAVRLATFQNNFSVIWLYIGLTVLALEKSRQEQNAGNFFNVRDSVIDMPKYYHAVFLNLYLVFIEGLILYETFALTLLFLVFRLTGIDLYQEMFLPGIFIALFAAWLLPVIYLLVINLNHIVAVALVFALLVSGLFTLPTPWSVATYNIAYLAGLSPNGLPLSHDNNTLIGSALLTTLVMIALLEGILYLHTRRQHHDK